MAQTISRHPLIERLGFDPTLPVCGSEWNWDSTSVFPCHFTSNNAPHSFSSTCCCYQKDKRAKPENFTKSSTLSEVGHVGQRNTGTYKSLVFGRLIDISVVRVYIYTVQSVCANCSSSYWLAVSNRTVTRLVYLYGLSAAKQSGGIKCGKFRRGGSCLFEPYCYVMFV